MHVIIIEVIFDDAASCLNKLDQQQKQSHQNACPDLFCSLQFIQDHACRGHSARKNDFSGAAQQSRGLFPRMLFLLSDAVLFLHRFHKPLRFSVQAGV